MTNKEVIICSLIGFAFGIAMLCAILLRLL